jgi:hypothetical protein
LRCSQELSKFALRNFLYLLQCCLLPKPMLVGVEK